MNASHERDRRLERLLRQWLKKPRQAAQSACLDAETIATWVDGGLSGAALETARTHAADCERCRALLGAVARTNTAVPRSVHVPRRWLAWALPLAAGATAVALWVAVPRDRGAPETPPAAAQEQAARDQPSLDQPDVRSSAAPGTQAAPAAPPAGKEEQPLTSGLRKDVPQRETDRLGRQQERAELAAASPDQAAARRGADRPATPPAELEARDRAAAPAAALLTEAARTRIVPILIMSPDPSVRWRLAGSMVEHSMDGGSTWDGVLSAPAELTAGAAPSPSVCWVVGRGGVVLRSTDGRSFSRLTFPEMTDLSAVRATDARTASVTSADGRVFSTTDGGATWQ